ncbi:MAG: hypothetical protein BGO26_10215 [Actinobacteria bacterium 69-20]|nr:hypothetical protein [Actinomycetota bacterium]OJV23273.1 MAG: hypothetical protein BGO26_10215 [Actinobacteria bacterium 69-20]
MSGLTCPSCTRESADGLACFDCVNRLLAEIDIRIVDAIGAQSRLSRGMETLLRALRKVVELHRSDGCGRCESCGEEGWGANFPCPTVSAVAEALGVSVHG